MNSAIEMMERENVNKLVIEIKILLKMAKPIFEMIMFFQGNYSTLHLGLDFFEKNIQYFKMLSEKKGEKDFTPEVKELYKDKQVKCFVRKFKAKLIKHCQIVSGKFKMRLGELPDKEILLIAKFFDVRNACEMLKDPELKDLLADRLGHFVGNKDFKPELIKLESMITSNLVEIPPAHEPTPPKELPKQRKERIYREDPLCWWEDHQQFLPILSQLAKVVLSIPASSAEVERSFSKHNRTVTPLRNKLSSNMIRMVLFLQQNWSKFNEN